ncbi:MAG TPA: hypothetical protein VH333_05800 [Pseudonocardiaceae bacterium]|nr:hypothetical protein [Pseudonocardiaceae bacterium]
MVTEPQLSTRTAGVSRRNSSSTNCPSSAGVNLRSSNGSQFQFAVDAIRHVAAAAVLVVDRDEFSHQWLSQGASEHRDAVLVADPWNPVTRFPAESTITPAELRRAATRWTSGDVFPPPVIRWRDASENEIGWICQ